MKNTMNRTIVMCVLVCGVPCMALAAGGKGAFLASRASVPVMNKGTSTYFTKAASSVTQVKTSTSGFMTGKFVGVTVDNKDRVARYQTYTQGYKPAVESRVEIINKMATAEYNFITTQFQQKEQALKEQLGSSGMPSAQRKILLGQLSALREDYASDMTAARKKYARMLNNEETYNQDYMDDIRWSAKTN